MYFIDNKQSLLGKTIAYEYYAQYANIIVLGTTDGGIRVYGLELDEDGDYIGACVGNKFRMEHQIFKEERRDFIIEELVKAGVIGPKDYAEHLEKRKQKQEAEKIASTAKREADEMATYLRLKAKFEGKQC